MRKNPVFFILLILLAGVGKFQAAEQLATYHANGVSVAISFERQGDSAKLRAAFSPDPFASPLHLYSKDLTGDLGRPTRIAFSDAAIITDGQLEADKKPYDLNGLPVYPEGPVTLTLPIKLPVTEDGSQVDATLLLNYMACTSTTCLIPVIDEPVKITLPSVIGKPLPSNQNAAVKTSAVEQAKPSAQALSDNRKNSINWLRAKNVAEAEGFIKEAAAKGQSVLLDFTGPSCVNCQQMAKTVFRLPEVAAAWNRAIAIEINTDPPHNDLAAWQQQKFNTQARPLYVRLDFDGKEAQWSEVFSTSDKPALERFLAFLNGGAGSDLATGNGAWQFLLLAVLGGLFTLLMPCTYPMIPLTLNYFAKQAADRRRMLPLAAFYGCGIMASFTCIGLVVTSLLGSSLTLLAGHPLTNLAIAALFLLFGLSLLGVWMPSLPYGLTSNFSRAKAGYAGALLMGFAFAITAFTCTAPFAGAVLAQAVSTGEWLKPAVGMLVYSSAMAVPFFLLALIPSAIKQLPRSGGWLNELKVVGGLVEIAAALKFLAVVDAAWAWGIVGRSFTLCWWAASAALAFFYIVGLIRLPSDTKLESFSPWRLLIALAFLAVSIWFFAGLAGLNLGIVESFFPADDAP